jgi:oligopeptidase A
MKALLDPHQLPNFPEMTPDAIGTALDEAIAECRAVVTDLTARRPKIFAEAWLPFERVTAALDTYWAAVSHMHKVVNTTELREAYAAGEQLIVENDMAIRQNQSLYSLFEEIAAAPDFADLALEDRVAVEHAIRDFILSGVALGDQERDRFREISVALSSLSTEFGSAVLDATNSWFEQVTDVTMLAGVPDADLAMFAKAAQERSLEGWVVTLHQPSVNAVLTFADDRGLRARVYEANATRASDQGPDAGRFDNSQRIRSMLALRQEAAALLGFSDPVEWSLATKMAANSGEVLDFLRGFAKRARPAAEREWAELQEFARDRFGLDELLPWDVGYVQKLLRQQRYAVDPNEVRQYFPVGRVLEGWKWLLGRLYGVRLTQRSDVPLYHSDAQYFDVADEQGEIIAGVYLDLHVRRGKRNGAWMGAARPRLRNGNVRTLPVAYLNCNFAPGAPGAPSLLRHDDIQTLLHESGHVLHHLFSEVIRPSIAGTAGVEWDAIELPSQLMEDFAWDLDVLARMSSHVESGEPLPEALYKKMLAARQFQSGLFMLRQVELSLFDILLHLGSIGSDPVIVQEAVREEIAVIIPPAWNRFSHAFTHIFSGPYAAGYYSYLWAEVLSADGFEKFAEAGLLDRSTGDLFRREVLARGATRPAAESFRAFRGRDADLTAILRRSGLLGEQA